MAATTAARIGFSMTFPPVFKALGYGNKTMTQEIFRDDAYCTEVEATVIARDARGIVLDRTIFYPKGGGQAGDAGTIVRADGSTIAIVDTVKSPSPEIL